jgi:hypothetical protein
VRQRVAEAMARLRIDYARRVPGKVEQLARAIVLARESCEADAWADARLKAHTLRGTSGSYGEMAISEAAGLIESLLKQLPATAEVAEAIHAKIQSALLLARPETDRANQDV